MRPAAAAAVLGLALAVGAPTAWAVTRPDAAAGPPVQRVLQRPDVATPAPSGASALPPVSVRDAAPTDTPAAPPPVRLDLPGLGVTAPVDPVGVAGDGQMELLAALHEPLPTEDAAHLSACARCQSEVACLQRAVDAVTVPQFAEPGPPVAPPATVWAGIAAATGVSSAPRPASSAAATPTTPPATAGGTRAVTAATPPAAAPPPARGGEVLPFRRRRPLLLAVAAAVAGAVVGAGAVALLRGGDGVEPITAVALEPLGDEPAAGLAEVVVRPDGSRALQVDLDAPDVEDGYYEIWLIEPGIVDMVPLGVLRPGAQTFELPAGLDLGEFPIVDVSVEPLDGDPAHSGVSVARGVLES